MKTITGSKQGNHKIRVVIALLLISLIIGFVPNVDVVAATTYKSDKVDYPEGYIVVGESHAFYATFAANDLRTKKTNRLKGFESIIFDVTLSSNFVMSGNLFFVFEGSTAEEIGTQASKEYIYSDGEGVSGNAVKKIHSIIDNNPNIKHWNIISWHGEVNCTKDATILDYYAKSYKNWIDYEFPDADVYVVSQPIDAPYYKNYKSSVAAFNNKMQQTLSGNYIDLADTYAENCDTSIDPLHFSKAGYQDILVDLFTKVRQHRVSKYDPKEVGFIILSECHSDVLLWSLEKYYYDKSFVTEVPKDNIVPLSSKSLQYPDYWGGDVIVEYEGIEYEANEVINNAMKEHKNVKFWYIVYFVGSNAVRNRGVSGAMSYLKTNLDKIANNDYYAENTIALMTTPPMYGRGKAQARSIEDYNEAEMEYMAEIGYTDYAFDARDAFGKYINDTKLKRVEFPGYRFGASGDGLHYYGKQYWTVTVEAVNTIYNQTRGE